jgi:F0F1-type ATP synthase delta subunit
MSDPTYKLTQSVRSAAEVKRLLRSLDQIIASTHSTASRYENISKILTTSQRQLLIEDLQDRNTTLTEPDAENIISDIRNSIKKMPVATIELAFQPSADFTEEIADSINTITKTPCIIEIKHNPTIGGGVVIEFQGRHYDYSLGDKVNEISKV